MLFLFSRPPTESPSPPDFLSCNRREAARRLKSRSITKSLERMRAGHVRWQFGRSGPPASLSSDVSKRQMGHVMISSFLSVFFATLVGAGVGQTLRWRIQAPERRNVGASVVETASIALAF